MEVMSCEAAEGVLGSKHHSEPKVSEGQLENSTKMAPRCGVRQRSGLIGGVTSVAAAPAPSTLLHPVVVTAALRLAV